MNFWARYIANVLTSGLLLVGLWTAIRWAFFQVMPIGFFLDIRQNYLFVPSDTPYVYDVSIDRKVLFSLPSRAIVEMECREGEKTKKITSFQHSRVFTYDKTEETLREFQETIPVIDADECQMIFTITIELPLGVEKTEVIRTNWFKLPELSENN